MRTYLLGTDTVHTSAALCDYLDDRIEPDDTIYAVNSLPGGSETDADAVRDGEDALSVVDSRLGGVATVETHQFIRGNDPEDDILAVADEIEADELVIGVRERNPTGKILFGSTAQAILLASSRPIAVVPLA